MIGTQLGSYRIESELGSGGMGKVYLAEAVEAAAGLEPGRKVALKVVHPHLLETPGFFKRFLQEAELGKRIRHENVVRTFDVDAILHEGRHHHYMVMEYVEGKSLRELLVELGTIPEILLREVALQTIAGLAAIHREGIIHRDLKPENILITEDHEIRIMDLGVAKLQEATLAITRDGQFTGSLLYAAPEQFKNEEVGPAADLYSLGVLLHELATGQNPFRGDNASAVIHAHLTERPPSARERNESLSLFFSEVIAMLLAKEPADRVASAETLKTILQEAERSLWWVERAPALQRRVAWLPRIRVGRETGLRGRDGELQALNGAWDRARNGAGSTVFLEGEAGIGKTRLIDAFLRALGEQDLHVLYGSYPPSGGMGGLSEAILGKFGEARLADALAPYLTITPSLVPAFAALVRHEGPPPGAEPLGGGALQAVVVHLMRALAAEKPTIWIVDDLQFALQESFDLLLAMARAVEDHRVLLVATSRPEPALEDFSRLENFQRIPLRRLGAREVIDLLEEALRSEALAEMLGGKIARKSDGVPFFVFEMIRGLREGRFIRKQPDGSYVQTQAIDEIEVPSAVKDLIEGRMRGVTEEQRAILDVGAVQGMSFDPALVALVLDEKRVRVLRGLAEIQRRFGLVRDDGEWALFDQNQIQEVVYRGLPTHLRAEYHALLAEAYAERCDGEPMGDDTVFLAYHHLRGSRPREALPHLEPAFDHLDQSYRNDALLDLARRALDVKGLLEGKERVEVLLRQAGGLDLLGRRDEQRAALDEALSIAGESAPLLASLGGLLSDLAEREESDAALRRAIELAVESGDERVEGRARRWLGHNLRAQGRLEEGLREYERTMEIARALGDEREEATAAGSLGLAMNSLGRYEESLEWHKKDLEITRRQGDRRAEAACLGNMGNVLEHLGRLEEARDHQERCLTISAEVGYRRAECIASFSLGNLVHTLGDGGKALALYERCLALADEIGYRLASAAAPGNIGEIHLGEGRLAEAIAQNRTQLESAREIGYRQGEAHALLNMGILLGMLGAAPKAREMALAAVEITRGVGLRRLESYALDALAAACEHEGELDAARGHYKEAIALRRDMKYAIGLANSLASLGRVEARAGRDSEAKASLEEARDLAASLGAWQPFVLATCHLAALSGGDVAAAQESWDLRGSSLDHPARMAARFALWRATADARHLKEAHRLLDHIVEHAPEEHRGTMIENVLLHADIMKAWREYRRG